MKAPKGHYQAPSKFTAFDKWRKDFRDMPYNTPEERKACHDFLSAHLNTVVMQEQIPFSHYYIQDLTTLWKFKESLMYLHNNAEMRLYGKRLMVNLDDNTFRVDTVAVRNRKVNGEFIEWKSGKTATL